ncbi:conserved hypothetical protein [Bacillus vallismortis]
MVAPANQFPYTTIRKKLTKKIQMLYNNLGFLGRYWVKEIECEKNHIKEKKKNKMDRCIQYRFDRCTYFDD